MPPSLMELAKELTLALIQTGNLLPQDMQETLEKTYATLSVLNAQEECAALPPLPASKTGLVDWRKSMTKQAVTCLECGESFKQFSLRHLGTHGLDSRSYRTKYGIRRPNPFPLERRLKDAGRLSRRYVLGSSSSFSKRGNAMATRRLIWTEKLCMKRLKSRIRQYRHSRNSSA